MQLWRPLIITFIMKKILFITILIGLIIGCSKDTPVADFSINKTMALTTEFLKFTNKSTGATKYLWDFGDGTSSEFESPTHQFASNGSFNITLKASGKGGNDQMIKSVYIALPQKTTYQIINLRNGTLFDVGSFYWDGSDIFDFVSHGIIYSGKSSAKIETTRRSIFIVFRFSPGGVLNIVSDNFEITQYRLNIFQITNLTAFY